MSDSRTPGILLLGLSTLIFAGTTNEMLPAELFWGGAVISPIGLILFMRGNRKHLARSEQRTAQTLRPTIHNKARQTPSRPPLERPEQPESQPLRHRDQGVAESGVTKRHSVGERVGSEREFQPSDQDELVLYELDDSEELGDDEEFRISTDVSFPLEVQEQDSLAEQIEKLRRLHEDRIISSEEFSAAKSKLLK